MDLRDVLKERLGQEYFRIMSLRFPNYKEILEKRRKKARSEKLASVIISKFLGGFSTRRIAKEVGFSSWTIRHLLRNKLGQKYREIVRERVKVNILPEKAKNQSYELGYILGVLVGDGHLRRDCIILKTTDCEFANVFYYFLKRWSGLQPKVREYDRSIKGKIRHVFDVSLFSADAARFVQMLGIPYGNKLRTWRIPNIVLSSNDEIKKGFLAGFFDSEATVRLTYDINCYSINKAGLAQISLLLNSFGIPHQVSSYTPKNRKWSTFHVLTIKWRHASSFADKINFQLPRKRKQLKRLIG
jgi:intein/homing endonuclease